MGFFPTPFNGELEYIYSLVEEGIFFTQIKVIKGEQSGNNTDAVLNNSTDFRSESFKKLIEQHSSA